MIRLILGILATGMVTLILSSSAGAQATFKTLHKFTGGTDGDAPYAGLIFDQVGNLYGTTFQGGAHGWGTVFQLTPNQNGGWTEHVLDSFCSPTNCADGQRPQAGLIFDQVGNLYGTTWEGGAQGPGTVFQLTPNQNGGWTEHVLHSFCSRPHCADGGNPFAGLTFDLVGNLYGTTSTGGRSQYGGTVFQLTPNQNGGWTEHVLHNFCSRTNCADGYQPAAGVIFDQAGNLYGTTQYGGARGNNGDGTVFQLTPNQNGGWTERVLYSFCSRTNCTDGFLPQAGLIFDQAGNLYGTTHWGGAQGYGTVFQLTPNQNGGWTEHVLHGFLDKPGAYPYAGLILDKAGNVYGITEGDGSTTFGSVFEITP
jgi:uncharacterized repeat protein (TIGR03803 family)